MALGFFDGVHIGHRAVIQRAVSAAGERGLTPCVFTFRPEGAAPASKSGMTLLQTEEQKEAVFASLGVREVVCPPFEEFRAMTPERFVRDFLRGVLGAEVIVCGFNYHFGRGGPPARRSSGPSANPWGSRLPPCPRCCGGTGW